jgi:nucleoside-diphosphate-sugar epimerase
MTDVLVITGATGFLGNHVLKMSQEQIGKKFETVVSVDRFEKCNLYSKSSCKTLPLSQLKEITRGRNNCLIHLATAYIPAPETPETLQTLTKANVIFGSRVLDAIDSVSKMINTKSYLELLPICLQNEYSLSKLMFSKYCKTQNIPLTEVIIFDTFGITDTRGKVVSTFIDKINDSKQLTIPKNDIHINLTEGKVVASAILKALNYSLGTYTVRNKNDITLVRLIEVLEKQLGRKAEITRLSNKIDLVRCVDSMPENIIDYDEQNLFDDLKLQTPCK